MTQWAEKRKAKNVEKNMHYDFVKTRLYIISKEKDRKKDESW